MLPFLCGGADMCLCFYVYMLYTTGGGGLYIRYLYMSKKHIIGLNRVKKTYFYVKMTYVFMFLCFWECSIISLQADRAFGSFTDRFSVGLLYFIFYILFIIVVYVLLRI